MAFNMLIVDDNAVFRMDLASRLQQEGYQVKEAGTGKDAILHLNSTTYDLILTDLILPDINGLDLVKKIRDMKIDARVVILTGYADVASAIKALQLGADEYIEKEAIFEEVLDRIDRILQKLKLEREMISVQERYKNILENLNDAIGAVNEEGRITFISSSIKRILGYEPEEMIGRSFLEFVYPADQESVRKRVHQFMEDGSPNVHTNRILSKSGKIVWARFSDSPVKENREMGAFYTVLTDVTTTKKLQEELIKKESRALAGELAAFVAHDINTPLQGVLSILEHCRTEQQENRELLEYITLIQSGLLKIKSTVLNLLELEHPVIYETTDINLYLHKVFHLAETYLKSYGIAVELQLARELPKASISTKDFEQLLLGIIREEVRWFGREDWDTYPGLSVFETGKKIVENRLEEEEDGLFQHRNWQIESRCEGKMIYVIFHNMDLRTISGEDYSGKYSTIHSVIEANKCSIEVEGLPGREKTLSIGIPRVEDA